MPTDAQIQSAYTFARERYALLRVDTDAALAQLAQIPISLHCWQGDDVAGLESPNAELGGGIAATGNYIACASWRWRVTIPCAWPFSRS